MAFTCTIKVSPNTNRSHCILDKQDNLKCFLKSPPEKGLANAELIRLIAKALTIPQTHVTIIAGHTSRTKIIRIDADCSYEQLLAALAIEKQTSLL